MTGGIFICYRREDSGPYTGRLHDQLVRHFGRDRVFMDLDTLEPGQDFVDVIEQAVGSCDVLIAIIGKQWATVKDAQNRLRLDDDKDFIRLEIRTALSRSITVVPVLVAGAAMPPGDILPADIVKLARLQAYEIYDKQFTEGAQGLARLLEKKLPQTNKTQQRKEPNTPKGENDSSKDDDLRLRRTETYKDLWQMTELLPKWPRRVDVSYQDLTELSVRLQQWYFRKGGMFLSSEARRAYGDLQDSTSQILSNHASGPITDIHYDTIRIKCSELRTELTLDLQSRRR